MRTLLASLALMLVFLAVAGLAFLYSGLYDVAATAPDWPVTRWALQTARTRSIETHAADIPVPPGLDDPAKLLVGAEHFAAHCAVCHGAPGVPKGDIAHGLNPQPPDLTDASDRYTPPELFWILKHGIKMTGMPSWGDHSDDELWATVAFLEKLPGMTEQDYAKLVMASVAHSGHHQHEGHEAEPGAAIAEPPVAPPHDDTTGHRH
jgi:mono/diheme cytochrome c family protein